MKKRKKINPLSDRSSSTSPECWEEMQDDPPDCVDDLFPLVYKDLIEVDSETIANEGTE